MDYRCCAELYDPDRDEGGTGYLVASGLVLTAHHVLAPRGFQAELGKRYDTGSSVNIRMDGIYGRNVRRRSFGMTMNMMRRSYG